MQVASFVKEGGCCEYHMMVHTLAAGSFEQQLEALHEAFDDAMDDMCRGAHPVFVRYFLSDISNQAETLKNILDKRQSCAVSIIGQPPLDGSKVAMWAYLLSEADVVSCGEGLWKADYLGYEHLWLGDACGRGDCSEEQTIRLIDSYQHPGPLSAHLVLRSGCGCELCRSSDRKEAAVRYDGIDGRYPLSCQHGNRRKQ